MVGALWWGGRGDFHSNTAKHRPPCGYGGARMNALGRFALCWLLLCVIPTVLLMRCLCLWRSGDESAEFLSYFTKGLAYENTSHTPAAVIWRGDFSFDSFRRVLRLGHSGVGGFWLVGGGGAGL